jgi:hypothetical protein
MGTNTLDSQVSKTVITTTDLNQFKTALTGAIVPRNASGVPQDLQGDLGSSAYRWQNAYVDKYYIGDPADNNYITSDVSGNIFIYRNSILMMTIASTGFNGSSLTNASVARTKLEAVGQQVSGSSGTWSSTAAAFTDVANHSVSLTTVGRPIILSLKAASTNSYIRVFDTAGTGTTCSATIRYDVGGSPTTATQLGIGGAAGALYSEYSPGAFYFLYHPSASTYTIKTQVAVTTGSTLTIKDCSLVAYEL